MYPNIPYDGLSWPITQHAGVLSEDSLKGLLEACLQCRGETVDPKKINSYLVENGILTANVRADSNQIDAWRDYQQILSEFGLLYSTRLSKVIRLTPVAMAYLNRNLSYKELITLQVLRYQYPNGHKSQLSPSLVQSFSGGFTFDSFTELQAESNILVRPAVLIWQVLYKLWEKGQSTVITLDEMQRYIVRCTQHSDVDLCVDAIIASRQMECSLEPLSRARRNMADWMKILAQTLLFKISADGDSVVLSSFSIRSNREIQRICTLLSFPNSFWQYPGDNFKQDWFDYYGNYDENIKFIIKE